MTDNRQYPIGTHGIKWEDNEKHQWFEQQVVQRSYQTEVVDKINDLSNYFDVVNYGKLTQKGICYPLYALKTKHWQKDRSTVLVTGGVHGYETSGVQGALQFLHLLAHDHSFTYAQQVNIVVVPCVSPWGYETINRWNADALDPNRSFYDNSPAQESSALMHFVHSLKTDFCLHIDLHETTDTDNSVFRPALAARDAIEQKNWNIPDGFYLVGNSPNPQAEFQHAIIQAVEKVTHIAPADENGMLIGVELAQFGVINYEGRTLGLCMGLTDANYVTTTEVYPDSPKVDDQNCILAQVAAVTSAIDFVLSKQ